MKLEGGAAEPAQLSATVSYKLKQLLARIRIFNAVFDKFWKDDLLALTNFSL